MHRPMDIEQNINIGIILPVAFTMMLIENYISILNRLGSAGHVSIEMDTDKPYIYHEEHKRKYPPGQFKKNGKKKKKW